MSRPIPAESEMVATMGVLPTGAICDDCRDQADSKGFCACRRRLVSMLGSPAEPAKRARIRAALEAAAVNLEQKALIEKLERQLDSALKNMEPAPYELPRESPPATPRFGGPVTPSCGSIPPPEARARYPFANLICQEPAGHTGDCHDDYGGKDGAAGFSLSWVNPRVGSIQCDKLGRSHVTPAEDLLETAWGVIANAGWRGESKSPGWDEAAARWRDEYFEHLRGQKVESVPAKPALTFPERKAKQEAKPTHAHVAGHVGEDGRFYAHRNIAQGEVFKARLGTPPPEKMPGYDFLPVTFACSCCGFKAPLDEHQAPDLRSWGDLAFPLNPGPVDARREQKKLCPECAVKVAKFISHLSTPMLDEEDLL